MKWVDSSISVTYLLPESSTWKDVYNFIMLAHEKEVKSIAAFPNRKMYGIISHMPFKELAVKLLGEGLPISPQNFSKEEQAVLAMAEEDVVLQTKSAPKRQTSLDADVYSLIVNKEKFIIVIGLQNQFPYEIFGGKMNGLKLDLESKKVQGKLTKVSRGVYSLEIEETVIRDFSKQFTPVEKILFRSLSLMLRHGIPIEFIVEQMNKANDSMSSLSAAITRVLNKYIKDGQKVSGAKCPNCGGQMFYMNGCSSCACGYEACH
jgi:ribonucleoside-diphosphate reductase alpha chain